MNDDHRKNYKSTLMISAHIAHVANLKVQSRAKLHINQNLTLQDVIKIHPSATVSDIEDLLQGLLMEIEDYQKEIQQNECRIEALTETLSAYADELNWAREDDCTLSRLWLEPDSSTPQQYNGFELAQKVLKGLT